jgi:polysaccharide pyruvyl transferase WcaK-like protein
MARLAADPRTLLPDAGRMPSDYPTVGLVGFYGWGNYGDELFWKTFEEHLGASMSLVNVLSPAWAAGRATLRQAVAGSDVILIGGGDIVVPWERTRYWPPILLRRPVFIAGVGVPTWRAPTAEGVGLLRTFFRHPSVQSIAARDEASGAWIASELEPQVPVTISPDLTCALTLPAVERPLDPPIFGVAVRARPGGDDLSQVRRLCARAAALGYRVRPIVLATGETRAKDLVATGQLGLGDAELVATDDLDAISRAIGECSVFATMKFHGVVVATMYGVPTIAMMPTAKTRSFLTAVGRAADLAHFGAEDLPDRLTRDMPSIEPEIPMALRAGATAHLAQLRSEILAAAALGVGRAAASGQRRQDDVLDEVPAGQPIGHVEALGGELAHALEVEEAGP